MKETLPKSVQDLILSLREKLKDEPEIVDMFETMLLQHPRYDREENGGRQHLRHHRRYPGNVAA